MGSGARFLKLRRAALGDDLKGDHAAGEGVKGASGRRLLVCRLSAQVLCLKLVSWSRPYCQKNNALVRGHFQYAVRSTQYAVRTPVLYLHTTPAQGFRTLDFSPRVLEFAARVKTSCRGCVYGRVLEVSLSLRGFFLVYPAQYCTQCLHSTNKRRYFQYARSTYV